MRNEKDTTRREKNGVQKGGVPQWMWNVTWWIMLAAIVLNLISLLN